VGPQFRPQQIFPGVARGVAQTQPREMSQFVNENPGEFPHGATERNPALAEEGAAVSRPAGVAQVVGRVEADWGAPEGREAAQDR